MPRRPVQGRGVYDAPAGLPTDKLYKVWHGMFCRCYGARTKSNECYIGCEVAPEWFSYMAFREWALNQDWEGNQLDKDLLIPGNKVYGPEACSFVPRFVNMVTPSSHGKGFAFYPELSKPYVAQFKGKWLGAFKTEKEAVEAKAKAKALMAQDVLRRYLSEKRPDPRVVEALKLMIEVRYV